MLTFIAGAVAITIGAGGLAWAGLGTARPPIKSIVPGNGLSVADLLPPQATRNNAANIHQFDVVGFIQNETVGPVTGFTGGCAEPASSSTVGGTVKINNVVITVPCSMIIQMPANTFRWADFVNGGPPLGFDPVTGAPLGHPSFEMHVVGNIVNGQHIAGLMFASQQAANVGIGYIKSIDGPNGVMTVDTGDPAHPATLQLNDPTGEYSAGQSPDPRFSVDNANPTIHSKTGYPMCIQRFAPPADDPNCPTQNRPLVSAPGGCRTFAQALVPLPSAGEIAAVQPGQTICKAFVMPPLTQFTPPPVVAGHGSLTATGVVPARSATDPDPRKQVPFEVGDYITWIGTLFHGGTTLLPNVLPTPVAGAPAFQPVSGNAPAGDYISVHTIEALDVMPFTQPGTQPAYIALGGFGIGTADPSPPPGTAINGAGVEVADRLFTETETTDVKTPVDIYVEDVNSSSGVLRNRWVTPFAMTGEAQFGDPSLLGGGITTQNTGPQFQRARIRTALAPLGLLNQPSRTMRVVQRTLCFPTLPTGQPDSTTPSGVDGCLQTAVNGASSPTDPTVALNHANGLVAGQYIAPQFGFIFPENLKGGDPIIPNDLWHLPFIAKGEDASHIATNPLAVGPLTPLPY